MGWHSFERVLLSGKLKSRMDVYILYIMMAECYSHAPKIYGNARSGLKVREQIVAKLFRKK